MEWPRKISVKIWETAPKISRGELLMPSSDSESVNPAVTDPRHGHLWQLFFLIPIGTAFAIFAAMAGISGDWLGFAYLVLGAFFWFGVAYVGWVSWRRRPRQASAFELIELDGKSALAVNYVNAMHVGIVVLMGVVAITASFTTVYTYRTGSGFESAWLFLVVSLLFGSFLFEVAIGTYRRGSIAVTPEGIRNRGWSFVSFMPWEAVWDVGFFMLKRPNLVIDVKSELENSVTWRRTALLWRVEKRPIGASMYIDLIYVDAVPVSLKAVLDYYLQNENMRSELGTASSLLHARQIVEASQTNEPRKAPRAGKPASLT